MTILIAAIVLASVAVLIVDSCRELAIRKNSLDIAWDYLENRLSKKCAFLEKFADTCRVFIPKEESAIGNLIKAKNELIGAKTSQAKARAEMVVDDAMKSLLETSAKYPELGANEDFLRIREKLDFMESETRYAKRFYNVNALDFNDSLGSSFKKIPARILGYGEREYFNPSARGDSHPDYRAELEKHREEDIKLCKRRCDVCQYKKVDRVGYRRMAISIILTLFIIGVACYAAYSLFHIAPTVKNLAVRLIESDDRLSSSLKSAGSVSPGWKTFENGIFGITYPHDWQMKRNGTDEISLRKSETDPAGYTGLDIEIKIGRIGNPQSLSMMKVLSGLSMTGDNFSMPRDAGDDIHHDFITVGGKGAMMMEHLMGGTSIYMKSYYWEMDKEIHYLDAIFYNKDHADDQVLAEKIIGTFKFLN